MSLQRSIAIGIIQWLLLIGFTDLGRAQESADDSAEQTKSPTTNEADETTLEAPQAVDIQPRASDAEIAERLLAIIEATQWFDDPQVRVQEGVVFLEGTTRQERYRDWAERLAGKTQDVVATVNRIRVVEASVWDLTPAWNALAKLARDMVRLMPFVVVGMGILLVFWLLARVIRAWSRRLAGRSVESKLLQDVAGTAASILTIVVGLYVAMRVSGLTQLALTIVGGTGLVGLAIGFAFRDIAENYLASILISLNRPFRLGDLVNIDGHEGFVQRVTTRGTLLMTPDGDHVHLPNSTVYKSVVINFTANENSRLSFVVGIGYDDAIQEAQNIIREVLAKHVAVLDDPPSMTVVDALGAATVNLQVLFWVNVRKHSKLKVSSSVMRQVKQALQAAEISMPDESREVIFPAGVPVRMLTDSSADKQPGRPHSDRPSTDLVSAPPPPEPDTSEAEGGLESEAAIIEQQARDSDRLDLAENLLEP